MHETLLIVFLGILAIAVLSQSIVYFLIFKSIRRFTGQMDGISKELRAKVEHISESVDAAVSTIKGIGDAVKPVAQKLSETSEIVQHRIADIDGFLGEATTIARKEMLRVQDTIQTAARLTQETITTLRENILAPVNEITAITRAVKVVIDALFRRRRSAARASSRDDEMFS